VAGRIHLQVLHNVLGSMLRKRKGAWFQDWDANESGKSRLVMVSFRAAQDLQSSSPIVAKLSRALYQVAINWVIGVEIPLSVSIGPRFAVFHPVAIVVNPDVVFGSDCTIRNNSTFGNRPDSSGAQTRSPRIGNGVEFGCNCVVIGDIEIGDGARIGAGAIVVKSVGPAQTVIGVAARSLGEVPRVDAITSTS
jgi:putative colanic acid biosynthesis acetyltransferase WcaB